MKHLFIIILSSFLLGASLYSNPSTAPGELLVKQTGTFPCCNEPADFLTGSDYHAILTHFGQGTRPGSQWKPSRCENFIRTDATATGSVPGPDTDQFIRPYSYCTPIALKLVFPQHYFW